MNKFNLIALLAGTTIVTTFIGGAAALAENFVVDGSNKALNTNNNFRRVDGNPVMSLWDFNSNDRDQQFDRIPGNRGGTLLRHGSTGKCVNSHYLTNGGVLNTWSCDANDPDQNFNIISLGNGLSQIQRTGTNLCVDSPTRDNGGKIHVWQCDRNNPNQRFRNGAATPPPPPADNWTEQRVSLSQYELYIVARKRENQIPALNDVGHAWIAIIRQDYTLVKTFRNGVFQREQAVFDKGGWKADTTYGFWNSKPSLAINNSSDFSLTDKYLRGESLSPRGQAVRKLKISPSRADWIKRGGYNNAGCSSYVPIMGIQGGCNCLDYATRLWQNFTGEDFRVRAVTTELTPDALVETINQFNRDSSDFVKNGQMWN
ncbi:MULTISPECIES: RICIN domain-containing protein [unclassified Dolichospermum]|uniref:RICIN domain-containing protein n=1 Tax=unclassified Dolichospermum TaxID=2622029 RepID=UPI001446BCD8|nr:MULTISPECIES: RICIN domain-containing protein [unclassified Dolichospermum]MTJ15844.1 ricin-type beta-trefoil lectin domain protein [Dolichospermum sp. UHCC 0299]MTJ41613.1 ricin-type beta-trefoil lectin domain protein [Dolichospermum sp. UHCC 0406]